MVASIRRDTPRSVQSRVGSHVHLEGAETTCLRCHISNPTPVRRKLREKLAHARADLGSLRPPESGSRQIVQSLTAGPPLAKSTRPPWCAVHASGILLILDSRRSSSGVAPLAAFRYKLKMLPPRSEANTIDVPSGDQIGTMLCDRSNVN